MRFKEWFEGLYGLGPSGEVGGFHPVGPNDDAYTKKGIGSKWQSTNQAKRNRFSGLASAAPHPDSNAVSSSGQPVRRLAAGLL